VPPSVEHRAQRTSESTPRSDNGATENCQTPARHRLAPPRAAREVMALPEEQAVFERHRDHSAAARNKLKIDQAGRRHSASSPRSPRPRWERRRDRQTRARRSRLMRAAARCTRASSDRSRPREIRARGSGTDSHLEARNSTPGSRTRRRIVARALRRRGRDEGDSSAHPALRPRETAARRAAPETAEAQIVGRIGGWVCARAPRRREETARTLQCRNGRPATACCNAVGCTGFAPVGQRRLARGGSPLGT